MRTPRPAAGVLLVAGAACAAPGASPPPAEWVELFSGSGFGGWEVTPFGGAGAVTLEDGRIVLEAGSPLTGIHWRSEFPKVDYELEVVAARLSGSDFFCALTFPVADSFCSLILGGWGGSLCGLSCVDGADAASNPTKRFLSFETGRPYRVRVRVTRERLAAWLDDQPMVDQETSGHSFSVRPEVARSRPLGIASYATRGAVLEARWRRLALE